MRHQRLRKHDTPASASTNRPHSTIDPFGSVAAVTLLTHEDAIRGLIKDPVCIDPESGHGMLKFVFAAGRANLRSFSQAIFHYTYGRMACQHALYILVRFLSLSVERNDPFVKGRNLRLLEKPCREAPDVTCSRAFSKY